MLDINELVRYCECYNINISPKDRQDWVMFCNALKVLGFSESTFVALSDHDARNVAARVWKNERNPHRYSPSIDFATKKIVALAKEAGVDVRQFCKPDGSRRGARSRNAWKGRPAERPSVSEPAPEPEQSEPELPPVYVQPSVVEDSRKCVEQSNLYIYLCRVFGEEPVRRVCDEYKVGACRAFLKKAPGGLGTAYPYINKDGNIIDVHLMAYYTNGHRNKECFNWALATIGMSDRRAPWCLFGEHLTYRRPLAPVGIVESEKTALVASIAVPGMVWCATGSFHFLNERRLAAVKDRELYLFPDVDGVQKWNDKGKDLAALGFDIHLCGEYVRNHATRPKDDIADIIITKMTDDEKDR